MKVVLTGGAGFIGSHVAETFINENHEVLVIDDLSSGKAENLPEKAEFIELDIVEGNLTDTLRSWGAEAVCHHAAQISVRNSVSDPLDDLRKNIIGAVRLLEACREAECPKFIFASTGGALYGEQSAFPAPETHSTYPTSPYGISKLAAEKYLYFYRIQYGLHTTSLRYSNVYGPRQDPHGEAGVVAIFCEKLIAGETPVINGDGTQTRDFVYVKDVARANLLALESIIEGEFNIATGIETDINELAGKIKDVAGSSVEFPHGPPMPGEQKRSVLDPGPAEEKLKWRPRVSLDEGLRFTWEYFVNKAGR